MGAGVLAADPRNCGIRGQKPAQAEQWERDRRRHYVSSKVMSWTTLRRALEFADRIGENGKFRRWRAAMTEIHADVMELGWSDELQSFRQHYDADTLDAIGVF
jgi:GH15 family glucan-1,4-alpha-glucosidase